MKKKSYIILLLTFLVVTIIFLLPHKEKRTFDDVVTDYTTRFDVLQFGVYEQDADSTTVNEPIEWLVLSETNDKILVISKDTIISISYHDKIENITWDSSILRLYLNNVFYNMFLNDEEKSMVIPTILKNDGLNEFGFSNGENTIDKVFVLNLDEYKKYFNDDKERISKGTKYGKTIGLQLSSTLPIADVPIENGTFYWARDVGYHESDVACVNWDGRINVYGYNCKSDGMGVRPCMWLKKEALKWKKK
ncbi:MAG: hypothetical protein J6P02_03235 [Lachnospiraceae bacterium]|nr:hypothetical protein [Lachnospiraceae bacterium]